MIPRQLTSSLLLAACMLAVPIAPAQKGPSSTTNPRGTTTTPAPPIQNPPLQGPNDLVLFITGKVAMDDGGSLPDSVLIDRICNGHTRQQVHPDRNGNFTFQLGLKYADIGNDVSVEPQFGPSSGNSNRSSTGDSQMGISRQSLWGCEISAEGSGLRSAAMNLGSYSPGQTIEVGTIFLQRGDKAQGTTISATSYNAPKDAKKAHDKAMEALKKGHLEEAQKQLEKAVQIFPQFATAWQQLGNLYDHQNQAEPARKAYQQAVAADPRFVPPYISLAAIAAREGNWNDVLNMTQHGIDLDPLNYPFAYYYNSLANYRLNNLPAAEKGARSAERYDQQHRIPQVHLLLATILSDSKAYPEAITEYTTFLKLVPDAKDADAIRAKVASIQKLSAKAATDDE